MKNVSSRIQIVTLASAVFLGSFVGTILAVFALPSNAESRIAAFREIRVVGPSGKAQIIMRVSDTGPEISMLGKDGKQELLLEITDSPQPQKSPAKMAGIHFIDLTKKETVVKIVGEPDGFASIRLGFPGNEKSNIFAYADSSEVSGAGYLGVGPRAKNHFDITTERNSVNLRVGGSDQVIRLNRSEQKPPKILSENLHAGTSQDLGKVETEN